jgi:hypothetical protein
MTPGSGESGRRARNLALALVAAGACGSVVQPAVGRPAAPFCKGTSLSGRFAVVPGSAGAGNIVYTLRLTNTRSNACSLTGLPLVSLRGRYGKKLPTHVRAAQPGTTTAVLVTLAHGQSGVATARFSPDVPGPGESVTRQCEPTAYRLAVTGGGRTTSVPVKPATPVCEHGQLSFSVYSRRL